jgi:hypothetical protein
MRGSLSETTAFSYCDFLQCLFSNALETRKRRAVVKAGAPPRHAFFLKQVLMNLPILHDNQEVLLGIFDHPDVRDGIAIHQK